MEKKAIGFLENFESFFLSDDDARWKAIGLIIAVAGTCGSIDLVFLNSSVDDAVLLMGSLSLIVSLLWIAWYCSFRQPREVVLQPISRRALVFRVASLVSFVFSLRIPYVEARIAERKIVQASDNPTNPQNIEEVTRVLARARSAAIAIHPATLESVGSKFIAAARDNASAWEAALAFFDYRAYLTGIESYYPFGTPAPKGTPGTYYSLGTVPGKPSPEFTTSLKRVPIAMSARAEPIGSPVKQTAHEGPESLLGAGGDIALDGFYLRRIVLVGVTVHYRGGPVILDGVSFINCRFVIENSENGRALGSQLLASSSVTFKPPAT